MPVTQRAYRAACPNCGAPVEFASAASASAVCSFCRSTLVRDGEALKRIGLSAELFDDHSPLQLGASGTAQGMAFTLVGRLQYGYAGGTWNEWHALFDNGRSAWLSEDNGAYVLAFDAPLPADAPTALGSLRAGQRVLADGRAWDVASVQRARLIAAAGELPRAPRLQGHFEVADLRNSQGEVATLDASAANGKNGTNALSWSSGRAVLLADLKMSGLAETGEKTLGARGVTCPNCGNALTVTLGSSKSIACGQCHAVVDLSAGVGGELAHYVQNNAGPQGADPQIPLGRSGRLGAAVGAAAGLGAAAADWQVVGYQERCDIPAAGDDETTYWREYLLYNRESGFSFLVDSNEGWSWVRPLTGAPQVRGDTATWQGVSYRQRWDYGARVTWVQGEFYWRVERDARAQVTDYEASGADSRKRLSREAADNEVVWSAGSTLEASVVATAFGIADTQAAALRRDAAPLAPGGIGVGRVILIVLVVLVLIVLLTRCDSDRCDEYRQTFGSASDEYRQCVAQRSSGGVRTSGGSYGGWSSGGGGHK